MAAARWKKNESSDSRFSPAFINPFNPAKLLVLNHFNCNFLRNSTTCPRQQKTPQVHLAMGSTGVFRQWSFARARSAHASPS